MGGGTALGMVVIAVMLAGVPRSSRPETPQDFLGQHPDPVAAESYQRGRELLTRLDSASLAEAVGLFQEALDLEPGYALAYAGRAVAYLALGCGGFLQPEDAFPKARAAALTALQLNSTLREPHTSLGNYYRYYERDSGQAEAEFQLGTQPIRRYPCRPSIRSGGH